MTERALTSEEVSRLQSQGCRAADWGTVTAGDGFSPDKIVRTEFAGRCRLGAFLADSTGIADAEITDCDIGNDARVRRAAVRNYHIGARARVEDVREMRQDGMSAHGCGVRAAVLRESGGREIVLHPGLSAPAVWLEVFAGDGALLPEWEKLHARETAKYQSPCGVVGEGAEIIGCGWVKDAAFGAGARAEGALRIENSTVNGAVGAGTVLRESVIDAGGKVGDQCHVERCFIADGASLDYGFKAENSLFFANCDCRRGEACAALCLPFTVSHHQATLLIAVQTTFFNAGSGTNFSNHRYKLGPRHQGVLERGCKCGSGSYLLWPGRIGAFTTVIGRHPRTLDVSAFPFSLLREDAGKSVLLPGANLFTVGLLRDLGKWPERDRRADKNADALHFPALHPGMALALENALALLDAAPRPGGDIIHGNAVIPASYIARAQARYRTALDCYYGELAARAARVQNSPAGEGAADAVWLDVGGMYASRADVEELRERLQAGEFADYAGLRDALRKIGQAFPDRETAWAKRRFGARAETWTRRLRNWQAALPQAEEWLRRDAAKEFTEETQIGYGLFAPEEREAEYDRLNAETRRQAEQMIAAETKKNARAVARALQELQA